MIQVVHAESGAVLLGLFDSPPITDPMMPSYGREVQQQGQQNEWVKLADNVARNFAKNYLYLPRSQSLSLQAMFELRQNSFSSPLMAIPFVIRDTCCTHIPWATGLSRGMQRTYEATFEGHVEGSHRNQIRTVQFTVLDERHKQGRVSLSFSSQSWNQKFSPHCSDTGYTARGPHRSDYRHWADVGGCERADRVCALIHRAADSEPLHAVDRAWVPSPHRHLLVPGLRWMNHVRY